MSGLAALLWLTSVVELGRAASLASSFLTDCLPGWAWRNVTELRRERVRTCVCGEFGESYVWLVVSVSAECREWTMFACCTQSCLHPPQPTVH